MRGPPPQAYASVFSHNTLTVASPCLITSPGQAWLNFRPQLLSLSTDGGADALRCGHSYIVNPYGLALRNQTLCADLVTC